jgi:hypothetical protein
MEALKSEIPASGPVRQRAIFAPFWCQIEHEELPLKRRCELVGMPRATAYCRIDAVSRQACEHESDLQLRALIDEQYTVCMGAGVCWTTSLSGACGET